MLYYYSVTSVVLRTMVLSHCSENENSTVQLVSARIILRHYSDSFSENRKFITVVYKLLAARRDAKFIVRSILHNAIL